MLCLTGTERTIEALTRRLSSYSDVPLHEVRLDFLPDPSTAFGLPRRFPILFTCRSSAQGGGFSGPEAERRLILHAALDVGPRFLDVDFCEDMSLHRDLFEKRGPTRLIASHHVFDLSWRSSGLPKGFGETPADVFKVAVAVEDAADLTDLLTATKGLGKPTIRIAMGGPGRLSRILSTVMDSPINFVSPDDGPGTAKGQLTLSEARLLRADVTGLTPLGLLGGESVAASPGPRVYNRLFEAHGLPFVYTTLETRRPIETIELAEMLGFRALAVTMPHKAAVLPVLTEVRPPADLIGAVNTILLRNGARIGLNTDSIAIRQLLAPHRSRRALVLGAGGAARAAVVALRDLGCPVELCARNADAASAFASRLGARHIRWEQRFDAEFDLVVNATPSPDPIPEFTRWPGRVLLDASLSVAPTPIVQTARNSGATVMTGLSWWRAQGQAQLSAILEEYSVPTLPPLENDP
ncbi:MAG: type I 3-dehydroquinate dehydratase [Deltaproteobacteria bacterium]|nr:type I 3-dehydroquinate dehydratase [Deltaproteobacteria bacterium]